MYTITMHRIRDKVAFVEGNDRLVLTVDVDPLGIIDQMQKAINGLKALTEDSTDAEILACAVDLSTRMFGEEQTKKLVEFYHGNEKQIFSVVSKYFTERMSGLITDAQKKLGKKKLFRR